MQQIGLERSPAEVSYPLFQVHPAGTATTVGGGDVLHFALQQPGRLTGSAPTGTGAAGAIDRRAGCGFRPSTIP